MFERQTEDISGPFDARRSAPLEESDVESMDDLMDQRVVNEEVEGWEV